MYVLGLERPASMEWNSWEVEETKKQTSYGLLGGANQHNLYRTQFQFSWF